jgi:hypothetical protein
VEGEEQASPVIDDGGIGLRAKPHVQADCSAAPLGTGFPVMLNSPRKSLIVRRTSCGEYMFNSQYC